MEESLEQDCLGSQKPKNKKGGRCDPEKPFYEHVMNRPKPKLCLIKSKKLAEFRDEVKDPYIAAEKEKYELLKLKTECK